MPAQSREPSGAPATAILAITSHEQGALARDWAAAGLTGDFVVVSIPDEIFGEYDWPAVKYGVTGCAACVPLRQYLAAGDGPVRMVAMRTERQPDDSAGEESERGSLELLRRHVASSINSKDLKCYVLQIPLGSTGTGQTSHRRPKLAAQWLSLVLSPEDRPEPDAPDAGAQERIAELQLHAALGFLGVLGGSWPGLPEVENAKNLDLLRITRQNSHLVIGGQLARDLAVRFVAKVLPDACVAEVDAANFVRLTGDAAASEAARVSVELVRRHHPLRYERPTAQWLAPPGVSRRRVVGWYLGFLAEAVAHLGSSQPPGADDLVNRVAATSILETPDFGATVGAKKLKQRRGRSWQEMDDELVAIAKKALRAADDCDVVAVDQAVWRDIVGTTLAVSDGSDPAPMPDSPEVRVYPRKRNKRSQLLPVDLVFEDPEAIRAAPRPYISSLDLGPRSGDGWESVLRPDAGIPASGRIPAPPGTRLETDPNEGDWTAVPPSGNLQVNGSADRASVSLGEAPDDQRGSSTERDVVVKALVKEFALPPDCAVDVARAAVASVPKHVAPDITPPQGRPATATLDRLIASLKAEAAHRDGVEREVLKDVKVDPHDDPMVRDLLSNKASIWGRIHADVYRARLRAALDAAWWSHDAIGPRPDLADDISSRWRRFRWIIALTGVAAVTLGSLWWLFQRNLGDFTDSLLGIRVGPVTACLILVAFVAFVALVAGYRLFAAARAKAERIRRHLEFRQRAATLAAAAITERNRLRLVHKGTSLWSSVLGWTTIRGFAEVDLPGSALDPMDVARPRSMRLAKPVIKDRESEIKLKLIGKHAAPGWRMNWLSANLKALSIGVSLEELYRDDAVSDTGLAQAAVALAGGYAQETVSHHKAQSVANTLMSQRFCLPDLRVEVCTDLPEAYKPPPTADEWMERLRVGAPLAPYILPNGSPPHAGPPWHVAFSTAAETFQHASSVCESGIRIDVEGFRRDSAGDAEEDEGEYWNDGGGGLR